MPQNLQQQVLKQPKDKFDELHGYGSNRILANLFPYISMKIDESIVLFTEQHTELFWKLQRCPKKP